MLYSPRGAGGTHGGKALPEAAIFAYSAEIGLRPIPGGNRLPALYFKEILAIPPPMRIPIAKLPPAMPLLQLPTKTQGRVLGPDLADEYDIPLREDPELAFICVRLLALYFNRLAYRAQGPTALLRIIA
jgi:hypothetical protein